MAGTIHSQSDLPTQADNGRVAATGMLAYFIGHRTAANLLLMIMIIGGLSAFSRIQVQHFPDFEFQSVFVSVTWPGASAEEIDRSVVARLETVLREIDGIESVVAESSKEFANIHLHFMKGWDIKSAVSEVRLALDAVTDLPAEVELPTVSTGGFRDRVTDIVISGPVSLALLDQYTGELQRKLNQRGVARTFVDGVSKPEIRVDVDQEALEKSGISLDEVVSAVRGEVGDWPIGESESDAIRIRAQSNRNDAGSIADISVQSKVNGSRIQVGDLAVVRELGLDSGSVLLRDGRPAIVLHVDRDAHGDALKILKTVKVVVKEMSPTLPQGVDIELYRTKVKSVTARLNLLIDNAVLGLAIVSVLLFLFLSPSTAFWVAVGIPATMVGSIAMMYAFGITINMVSLFAMIICLGIIVDDAIVVGEDADRLARSGVSPSMSALGAAHRMWQPVLAASLTTILAFGSLVMISGEFGSFVDDLSLTICFIVFLSLVECFLVLPAHLNHGLRSSSDGWLERPSQLVNAGVNSFRDRLCRPLLQWTISLRYPVVCAALALLATSVAMLGNHSVLWQFFSPPEENSATVNFAMLADASRDDTRAMIAEVERALNVVSRRYQDEVEQDFEPVEMSLAKIGRSESMGNLTVSLEERDADLLGSVTIELIDSDFRSWPVYQFIADWEAEIVGHPKLEKILSHGEWFGPGGEDIHVQLSGGSVRTLKSAALSIQEAVSTIPSVSGVRDDLAYDKLESILTVSRRGEALGFDTEKIAMDLRSQLHGTVAATFTQADHHTDVWVMLSEPRTGEEFLNNARLPLADGGSVALNEVATFQSVQGFSTIRREDGAQVVNVTGSIAADALSYDATMDVLKNEILPDTASRFGVNWRLRGLAEQERKFLSDALLGFVLSLTAIYLVLTWIFASWVRAVVVILTIPFGLIGAVWGHYLHSVPFSMFSVVGLIGLSGILINDAIVLLTSIDKIGRSRAMLPAIVDGSLSRLRAVLLTTITTVGGLAPLLLEQSQQAQFLKPTVITLTYGLGFGMVIVLVVVPVLAAIEHDIRRCMKSFVRLMRIGFKWYRYG